MSLKGIFTLEKYRGRFVNNEWIAVGDPYEVAEQTNSIQYRIPEGLMTNSVYSTPSELRVAVSEYRNTKALNARIDPSYWISGDIQSSAVWTPPTYDEISPVSGFWTFRTRFIPPISVRYIRSLSLKRASNSVGCISLVTLDTPFVQDIADVLDITYRVFIDLDPVIAGKVNASQRRVSELGQYTIVPTSSSSFSSYTPYYPTLRGLEQMRADLSNQFNVMCNWRSSFTYGATRESSLSSTENQVFGHRFAFPIPGSERELHHGLLARSLMVGSTHQEKIASIQVDKGVASSVQNMFARRADTGGYRFPFLDIDNLATSQANVTITDSGAWASTVNESVAHHYRIEITTGGLVGNAEYRIRRRRCTGWNRASYTPMTTVVSTMKPTTNSLTWYETDDAVRHGQDVQELAQEYLWPEFITFDANGLTITNINGVFENIDSSSTVPLNVTGLLQVGVELAGAPLAKTGNLYVACEDTGLWKIERPSGGPVTSITQITPAGITNPNSCRGVTVNSTNGEVWALIHDTTDEILYMAKSVDQGDNWTLYSESTNPQFLLTNYTSGSPGPANVIALHISPFSSDNRFFICAPDVIDTTSGNQGFWWSEAGSSPTSDQIRLNITATNNITTMSHTKVKRLASLAVRGFKTTNTWVFRGTTANNSALSTFGSTSATLDTGLSKSAIGSRLPIVFETVSGNEILLGSRKVSNLSSFYVPGQDSVEGRDPANYGTGITNMVFCNTAESTTSNPSEDTATGQLTRDHGVSFRNAIQNILIHIGNGVFLTRPGGAYCLLSFYGDGRVTSETAHPWFESYGWNGSAWELNHSDSKITHAGNEDILDTLQINFDDDGGANPLIVGEYYDFYIYDGVILDDATAITQTVYTFMAETDYGTEFTPSVVPVSDEGVVVAEVASILWQGNQPARIGTSSPYAWGEPGKIIAGGSRTSVFSPSVGYLEHQLSGDFELRFKIANDSPNSTVSIGLCDWGAIESNPYNVTSLPSGFTFAIRYIRGNVTSATGDISYTVPITQTNLLSNNFVQTINKTTASENDIFALRRIGSTLEFLINDVVEYTYPSASSADLGVIFAGVGTAFGTGWTVYDMEVDYTISRRYVSVGNGTTTGASDEDFRKIITDPVTATELHVELNGTPATVLTDGVTPPAAGEVNVLPYSGRLWFNSADAGATITGYWRILKKLNLEE